MGIIKSDEFPRNATGPSIDQIMMGSEGTFGILTHVTLRGFKYMPENRKKSSYVFKDWENGLNAAREIMQGEFGFPSVFRLSDPEETAVAFRLYGVADTVIDKMLSAKGYKDGKRVAPVVSIVCNFTRPTSNTPALLTLDEAETRFHEFGHALHFLFHDVKYRGLTEVEGDFVELPSQLMENWAFDPEVLKQYAVHYRSNEVIPEYLVAKLRRSGLFNQGFMTTELIAASLSDMHIHSIPEY